MQIHAYAALSPGQKLVPFTYQAPPLAPFEVLLKISHCGLCHSDVHLIDNDWGKSKYPLVPGHEVIGTVVEKGSGIETLSLGDRVGVGWIRSACLHCPTCLEGETNICPQKTATCNGNYGGFADFVVADGRFAYLIPVGINSAHAAPLLCAGATVYAPLRRLVHPSQTVAVIGIGGLGHLALQFAAAFGCEVTAISHSLDKREESLRFGAHHFMALNELSPLPQFDFILSTVQADLDWNLILSLLKPKGTLCFVGRPLNLGKIELGQLISSQKTICGSTNASRSMMNEMLLFAARKKVEPKIELYSFSDVNQAIAKMKANKVRYRIVLKSQNDN
jgi:uncharacterized zinc-type alcohol dehydrogenase-like protein